VESELLESSADEHVSSRQDSSAVDSDNNASSVAAGSEDDSSVDLLESSSDGVDSEANELNVSFTVIDNACLDDVTQDTVQVSTTTNDGPPASAVNSVDIKLAVAADMDDDDDDHRHLIGSDRPCGDLKHDAHMPESLLVSRVAMDIN